MVVLLSKSKFASPPFACFYSYKAAACFAENHSFPLYLLRNKNLPKLSAEHLKEEIQHTNQKNQRKANVTSVFKREKKEDAGNYRLASLTSAPGKMIEEIILKNILRRVKDKKDIRSNLHRFTTGKSCLTSLRTFYDERPAW
ncbi:rna-directed dna polymerase from mobile element jockey- hypothetical protein [Limosa lapponica baueri]|uniref:Rna-directed dna polymerase from mobile element jockey-like n=1 Tax=Limosa lapponica baueri TaxID=1758121 RepID=A0A2I0TB67_LIMLA|nr:rna-directed dna polymerase from mobile element jockey- hypothetical protein [Limosa lapponica baueri]